MVRQINPFPMFRLYTPRVGTLAATLLVLPLCALRAQDYLVTSNADTGAGSLREAVTVATAGGGISFAEGLGAIVLSTPLEIAGVTSLTGASDGSTRVGGAGLLVSGSAGDTLYVSGLTFRGGTAVSGGALTVNSGAAVVAKDVNFESNTATGDAAAQGGGAVYNAGYFYAENVSFAYNKAQGASGSGGAILNGDGGTLELVRSTFTENFARRAGGAIEDASGASSKVSLSEVTLASNYVRTNPGSGAGLHVTGDGDVAVYGGSATGNNAAAEGGAFWNGTGELYLSDVRIADNTANGGVVGQGGGGVYNSGGRVVAVGSTTFSGNRAVGHAGSGGAILNGPGGKVELYGSTLSGNTAVRAGGAIEDNSGAGLEVVLAQITATGNRTSSNPGNGGAVHVTGAGDVDIHGGDFSDNYAAADGGALWNGTGTMRIRQATISGNEAAGPAPANGGGGIYNMGGTLDIDDDVVIAGNFTSKENGSGGGIHNATGGKLKFYNSTLRDNTSEGVGGGLEDASGASTVTEIYSSTLSGNETVDLPGCGGAVHFKGMSNGRVVDSDVIGNRGTEGGGLWNGGGELYVTGTTVTDNVAYGDAPTHKGGGGLYNGEGYLEVRTSTIANNSSEGSEGLGGGIKQDVVGRSFVVSSTIVDNSSAFNGGAIGSYSKFEIVSSTVARNAAANNGGAIALSIYAYEALPSNTIFVGNTADGTGSNFYAAGVANVLSQGYNLLDAVDVDYYTLAATDVVLGDGQTAGLGELADNGGRTMTLALECGSAAIDAGSADIAGPDQTGNTGNGARRDIGAVENQGNCGTPDGSDSTAVADAPTPIKAFPTILRDGNLTVDLGETAQASSTLQVLDANGFVKQVLEITGSNATVQVRDLQAGQYFLRSVGAEGVRTGSFVVAR